MNSKRSIVGCPIRESSGQSVIPARRSVSSVSTPFIVFGCLGIRHKPLFFRERNSIICMDVRNRVRLDFALLKDSCIELEGHDIDCIEYGKVLG